MLRRVFFSLLQSLGFVKRIWRLPALFTKLSDYFLVGWNRRLTAVFKALVWMGEHEFNMFLQPTLHELTTCTGTTYSATWWTKQIKQEAGFVGKGLVAFFQWRYPLNTLLEGWWWWGVSTAVFKVRKVNPVGSLRRSRRFTWWQNIWAFHFQTFSVIKHLKSQFLSNEMLSNFGWFQDHPLI